MTGDLSRLLRYLPARIATKVERFQDDLVEIILDWGRPPLVRLAHGHRPLSSVEVSPQELQAVVSLIGQFKRSNRAGLDRTLHRLSVVRNAFGDPVGLTIRVGRSVTGVADPLRDVLLDSSDSLLLIGPPGAGKTTLLRDCARLLSEHLGPAVVVVDSHNEIGGDGDLPHPAIGAARRLQVPYPTSPFPATQYDVMLEAVKNHQPDVVIVDEITTRQEADAARTIARRGVRLIATAHGNTLADVLHNAELQGLVLGARRADVRTGTGRRQPHSYEPPIMQRAVEVRRDRTVSLYHDVARAVDGLLSGRAAEPDAERSIAVTSEPLVAARVRVRTDDAIPEDDPWGAVELPVDAAPL